MSAVGKFIAREILAALVVERNQALILTFLWRFGRPGVHAKRSYTHGFEQLCAVRLCVEECEALARTFLFAAV